MTSSNDLVREFFRLRMQLLLPLRATRDKAISDQDIAPLTEALARFRSEYSPDDKLPVELAGIMWMIFSDLMTQADYANDPGAIQYWAWQVHEELRKSFEPPTSSQASNGSRYLETRLNWDVLRVAYTARQHPIDFTFFWGHRPDSNGNSWPGCLSQWWPALIALDGETFHSSEHYMMWKKAELFGDRASAEAILASTSPRDAKQIGRIVRGFRDDLWQDHRIPIVLAANRAKFTQHEHLRALLLENNSILVEASPTDRIWGIGLSSTHPDARNPLRWRGENLLGFALMQTREELLNVIPR